LPERVDSLEQARTAVRRLEQDRIASEVAASELAAAREALARADQAYARNKSLDVIEHEAYVAQRYADLSKERIAEAHAKEQLAQSEAEHNRIVLQARSRGLDSELALSSADARAASQ
jgi:hypothetical protein